MNQYDPDKAMAPEAWLEIDEQERIKWVRSFHEGIGEEMPEDALRMHSLVHVIIENQAAMGVDTVVKTLTKLTKQGLDRHEAIHAVGAILSEELFELLKGNIQEISPTKYKRKFEKITAKRWRKGQY